ncbi:uncharacterized protein LOC109716078, partial [Ananas comosus]|uniref:Uncharacterized protein LOC109716078 n=1 Tax=Ananas comosus TaxID=4615 RepID=A0A6P5FLZ2_ANACO
MTLLLSFFFIMMQIVIWNCNGGIKKDVKNRCRNFIKNYNVAMIILLETHVSGIRSESIARAMGRNWRFQSIDAVGRSGGILMAWRDDAGLVTCIQRSRQALHAIITIDNGPTWVLSSVYSSVKLSEQRKLWKELEKIGGLNLPWLTCGDFNAICSPDDKLGGKPFSFSPKNRAFSEFISTSGIIDLGFEGPAFTWCNNQDIRSRVWVRLDRAFANPDWISLFPGVRVKHLVRAASDHAPLLIMVKGDEIQGRRPFRFEAFWFEYDECGKVVERTWQSAAKGNPLHSFTHRVCNLRRALLNWNKEGVGNLETNLISTAADINYYESLEANSSISQNDIVKLNSLYNKHNALLRQINTKWWQKARIRWAQNGDLNTKFFHNTTRIRRHRNRINFIKCSNGVHATNQVDITNEFCRFYLSLWMPNTRTDSMPVSWPDLPAISQENAEVLIKPIEDLEIKQALWSMPNGKAPGPDGLQAEFFKNYWDIVGLDLCKAIKHFFLHANLPKGWGQTYITLVPKKENPSRVADFRPISLCNVCYKIISKILVNRLKPLLPTLIGYEQAAFVAGRDISDNILAAQELAHTMVNNKKDHPMMIVKYDMEKAYDRVRWDSVTTVLSLMRFPIKWVNWIMACISSPTYAFIINGKASDWIQPAGGLRQGDPLSPYLFILIAQVLTSLLNEAQSCGSFTGIPVGDNSYLSHLMYADDILITGAISRRNCRGIEAILHKYECLSGQRVNKDKSALYLPDWLSARMKNMVTRWLNLPKGTMPFKYLGSQISGKRVKVEQSNFLVERVRSKLTSWKKNALSLAGRAILIRATLTAIPNYWMTASWIPDSVVDKITQIIRKFLWEKHGGKKGMHLIAWDNITKPLTEGGLNFRNLRKSREAFMARNALKLLNNINLPWVRIMKGKYGELDPWKNPKLTTTSWAWRALNYTVQAIKLGLQISISDGLNTNFLEHPWLFTTPFSKKPTFIATNIGEKVQHINQIIENGEWCYNSIEGLVGEDLVDAITNLQLGEGPDKWVWSLHPQGKARAGSVYSFLNGHTDNCWDGWKQLWGLAVAPRVKTFLWKYFWKRLPTKDFLQQRGLTQSNLCALCGEAAENIQHLFFQCRYSKEVWHIFQLDWGKVINVQQLHDGCWLTSKVPNDLKAMIASILWCIWKSRCATLFNCESFIAPTIFRCAMTFWNAYNPTNKPTNKFAKQSTMDVETIVKWDPPPPGCFKI